jgi:hypothetical protein
MSSDGDYFATSNIAVGPATVGPPTVAPWRRVSAPVLALAAAGLALVAVLAVLAAQPAPAPHGPSTGLQATTRLDVVFPAELDGYQIDRKASQEFSDQVANSGVPAMALSSGADYSLGVNTIIVAGGPLPSGLRFTGNAEQAGLIRQIGIDYSHGKGRHPKDWGPRPTGEFGGQLWCGTETALKNGPLYASCWMVDSQNVLNIVVFGPDPMATAERTRELVEVPHN